MDRAPTSDRSNLAALTGNWSELTVNRRGFLTTLACAAAASFKLGLVQPLVGERVNMLDVHNFSKMRRYAQLRNCRVAYAQHGHGHAALFLHGFRLTDFSGAVSFRFSRRTAAALRLIS
jgi:hypothetical protein